MGLFSQEDTLFIVFKGSSNIDDIYTDFNIKLVNKEGLPGVVHNGFSSSILKNKVKIYSLLVPLIKSFKTVIVTGHSLGAALSIILFKLISRDFPKKDVRNINFGCPKIGNAEFCKNTITNRIVLSKDIISFLPFTFFGYSHVDYPIVLHSDKIFPNTNDHHIESYFQSLTKNFEKLK
jgi:predicted lipase